MKTQEIFDMEEKYGMKIYHKRNVALVKGDKEFVWDSEGKKYIDCTTGIGIAILGHAHPTLLKAINLQASRMMTCHGTFYNEERALLESKLVELSGGDSRVMLINSGTEAVEAAIKLVRKQTKRKNFIAAMNGYHGKSTGALSLTYGEKYRTPFEPLLGPVTRIRYNSIEALKEAVTNETAAVFLEPIQGEGGIRVADIEYLKAAQDICRDAGALLVFDEVQTGCGRTGKFFAYEHANIKPDITCLAKGLAGGVPIGAIIAREEVSAFAYEHTSTFGGNPLAAAAANATIGIIEKDKLLSKVTADGIYIIDKLKKELASKKQVREVRGKGLMIGIELKVPARSVIIALADKGILATDAGEQIIRLLPPFIISESSIDEVVGKIAESLV